MNKSKSIKTRLLGLLAVVVLLIAAAAATGFWLCWDSIRMFQNDVAAKTGERRAVLTLQTDFKKQVQEWKDTLLRGTDATARERYWGNFRSQEKQVHDAAAALREHVAEPQARDLIGRFLAAHETMGAAYRKGFDAYVASGLNAQAGDLAVAGIDRAPTELLTQASESISRAADEVAARAAAEASRAIQMSLAVMLASIVAAIALFWWQLTARVVRPAEGLVADLERLAGGDFTRAVACGSMDELGSVAESAEKLRRDLGRVIAETKDAANQTSAAAVQLSSTATEVTIATERESEAAASTAAAVEELAVSVSVVASNSADVKEIARQSLARSQQSRGSLGGLVERVHHARGASDRISASVTEFITKTRAIIDMTEQVKGLAAQTNLLALNAAIEAARAGEQGRGFAVVANEVRSLAEKSGKTADDIARLTQDLGGQSGSVEQAVAEGLAALAASESHIGHLQDGFAQAEQLIERSSHGVNEMASAVAEQTAASDQIAKSMESVAQMAEEAHASVQQAAVSAKTLENLAARMHRNCEAFIVG
ncbi:MAG TPA: methyl-accepting chemotaxis protein [Burkholderiales bacterium]